MEDHPRSAPASAAVGRKKGRRTEAFAGRAVMGLSLGIGALTLVVDDPSIPVWLWAGLLVVWCATTSLSASELPGRSGQLLLYACAVLTSWLLVLTAIGGGMTVILLIVVAALGSYLMPMRWVLGVVLLNCVVVFGHTWVSTADMVEAVVFASFYLIIHLATVFSTYATWRESQLRTTLEQKNLELVAAGVRLEDSAASAERLRISRELHDLIGHQLTVLNLELEAAKHREGTAAREHVERAGSVAKDLLADVRSTVGELREADPGDLQQSLQRLAGAVPRLEIHVEVGAGVQPDEDVSAALVRAAQEIITNTVKHAEASELALTVELDEGTLTLKGTNDGPTPHSITPGHGLTGLKERLEPLGGSLDISTRPYFTVQVQLPLNRDRQLQP